MTPMILGTSESSDEEKLCLHSSRVTGPRRGRPRLSKASAVVFGDSLEKRIGHFIFQPLDVYHAMVKEVEEASNELRPTFGRGPSMFKLHEGDSTIDAVLRQNDLDVHDINEVVDQLKQKHNREKETSRFPTDPCYHELLYPEGQQICTQEEVLAPARLKDKRLELIRLVALEHFSIQKAAVRLQLPYSTAWKLVAKYSRSPIHYCNTIKASYVRFSFFDRVGKDQIRECLASLSTPLVNWTQAESFLKRFLPSRTKLSSKRIMKISKDELSMRKAVPKIVRGVPRRVFSEELIRRVDEVLIHLFYHRNVMLIYDSTTFMNDKKGITCYTMPGIRPTLPAPSSPVGLHLLCMISSDRIESTQLVKGGLDAQKTRDFFMISLARILSQTDKKNKVKYLFLDNAPVHSPDLAREVFTKYGVTLLFNLPRNPHTNPIEMLFGSLKKIYRKIAAASSSLRSADNQEALFRSTGDNYRRLMSYAINKVLSKF